MTFYTADARRTAHQARRLRMIERLLLGCRGQALDYGCGFGDITYAVSSRFEGIVGVDVDEQRVVWAAREFAPITFKSCADSHLDFPDQVFQTVLSIVVINWVKNPDCYIEEARRVLAPGGALVLAAAAPDRLGGVARRLRGRPAPDPGFRTMSLPRMNEWLTGHGFVIECTDCFYDAWSESLASWRGALASVIQLPMRLVAAQSFAPYYGLRARRR